MKKQKFTWIVLLILTTINNYSQQKPQAAKIAKAIYNYYYK